MATRNVAPMPGKPSPQVNPKKQQQQLGQQLGQQTREVFDEFLQETKHLTDLHGRQMLNLGFRYGYRCALVDGIVRPELVSPEKIIERAQFWLDDKFIKDSKIIVP